jgi:hypothetical protein
LLSTKTMTNTFPEVYYYTDNGCEVSKSCLSCPIPQCKYDDPIWFQQYQRHGRDLKLLTVMHLEGLTVEKTAERFSVTVRTVFRIMRRRRQENRNLSDDELYAFAAD